MVILKSFWTHSRQTEWTCYRVQAQASSKRLNISPEPNVCLWYIEIWCSQTKTLNLDPLCWWVFCCSPIQTWSAKQCISWGHKQTSELRSFLHYLITLKCVIDLVVVWILFCFGVFFELMNINFHNYNWFWVGFQWVSVIKSAW